MNYFTLPLRNINKLSNILMNLNVFEKAIYTLNHKAKLLVVTFMGLPAALNYLQLYSSIAAF